MKFCPTSAEIVSIINLGNRLLALGFPEMEMIPDSEESAANTIEPSEVEAEAI